MIYRKILTSIWADDKFPQFSDDEKLLCMYLFTSPHSNMIGLYRLPLGYAADDLKWTAQRFDKPFRELLRQGLFEWDEPTKLLFVVNFLEHDGLDNPNQTKAAIKVINELPKNPLFSSLLKKFEPIAKPFNEPFLERLRERLQEWYGKPGTGTDTDTGTGSNEKPAGKAPAEDQKEYPPEVQVLCTKLKKLREKLDPKFKPKAPNRWPQDMDRIIRLDKRTPAEVDEMIEWAVADRFWSAVILSPDNLRKHFPKMFVQKSRGGASNRAKSKHESSMDAINQAIADAEMEEGHGFKDNDQPGAEISRPRLAGQTGER